jgi:integrase/recombinase XerD
MNPQPYPALNTQRVDMPMSLSDRLYHYPQRLKNAEERLARDKIIRAVDRRLIQAFLKHIRAKNISVGRQAKYCNLLIRCAQLIRVPFRRARRRDIEDLFTRLADYEFTSTRDGPRKRYKPKTMDDFRLTIKIFMKFAREGHTDRDAPYPEEVRWLHKDMKLSEKVAASFFTEEEIISLIQSAKSDRDKAMFALVGELGMRPGELLQLKVGDVQFDDRGALINIEQGKTGPRRLRSIGAVRYLSDYLAGHAYRKDPSAPLWLTSAANYRDRPLSWTALMRSIKITARNAGIVRRVYTYMLRHSSATRNAKYLTDSELKIMYGWTMDSKMAGTYVHLSGADLDLKYQQIYSPGKAIEPPKPVFAPTICPRCQERAAPGMLFCPKCATPLDQAERAKMTVQEENTKKELSELRGLVEKYLQAPTSKEPNGG